MSTVPHNHEGKLGGEINASRSISHCGDKPWGNVARFRPVPLPPLSDNLWVGQQMIAARLMFDFFNNLRNMIRESLLGKMRGAATDMWYSRLSKLKRVRATVQDELDPASISFPIRRVRPEESQHDLDTDFPFFYELDLDLGHEVRTVPLPADSTGPPIEDSTALEEKGPEVQEPGLRQAVCEQFIDNISSTIHKVEEKIASIEAEQKGAFGKEGEDE